MHLSKGNVWRLAIGAGAAAVVLAVVGVLGGMGLSGRGGSSVAAPAAETGGGPAETTAVPVTVAAVTLRPIQRTVETVGTFSGFEEMVVSPEVDGRVVKINCDMGDVVRPGELLLEIDPTDFELAVEQARKAVESELAKAGLTALPGPDFEINKLPSIERARNLKDNAARKLVRAKQLRETKTIAQELLDQAETDYRVAEAGLRETVLVAQSVLATARHKQAELAVAEDHLRETKLAAPPLSLPAKGNTQTAAEYTVAERMISEGEMARRANAIGVFKLVVDKVLKLKATIPERYVGQVKAGQKVEVRVEAYPEKVFEGTVSRVSPTVDRISRTFQIETLVPNESRELKAGGFAKVAVLTHTDPQAPTVPVEAVVTFVGSIKVFVIQDGKAHAIEVTPGVSGRGWVEVQGKLPRDGRVITSGHDQLAEGTPVQIREASPNGGKPGERQPETTETQAGREQ